MHRWGAVHDSTPATAASSTIAGSSAEDAPIEACALLFGKMTRKEAIVERVVVASNRLSSTTRFEMDPEAFMTAYTEAERDGLELVGLFHSHPAPAQPSAVDLQSMKRWGTTIWLIRSSQDGLLAAYHLQDDRVRKTAITVAAGHSH